MTTKTIEILLPFDGFYNSIHDYRIDDALESYCTNEDGEVDKNKLDDLLTYTDWQALRLDYCKEYVSELNNKTSLYSIKNFNFDFKFKELDSPKFYNYRTDYLVVNVNRSIIEELFEYIDSEYKDEFIKFTDIKYSKGFYSKLTASNILEAIEAYLAFYFNQAYGEDWQYYLIEDIYSLTWSYFSQAENKTTKNISA